jgi:hypothetical protein
MRNLTLEAACDYLEAATIEQTIAAGHAVINIGVNEHGTRFVLMNDCTGSSVVTEA